MVRMVIMSVELEPKGGRLRESERESERERKERSEEKDGSGRQGGTSAY
jgi:hypothetical protein